MRILFCLPGLHRYSRGAEVAFISVARELARAGDRVTLIGSGEARPDTPYSFLHASSIARERFNAFPSLPLVRNETGYEELTFMPGLLRAYRPADYDVTVTCSYPFTNWALRRPVLRGRRPPHVFVTQNGDWPAYARNSEYRFFGCEGLVCTNLEYLERNKSRWRCRLIPNGVDGQHFSPGPPQREQFGLPADRLVVLMVSALIESKRVGLGVEAVSRVPDAHLLVAGDGPLRPAIDEMAARLLPGRFTRVSVTPEKMPALYRSADVFMHLSQNESFGNVYPEALACGLPIVSVDTPHVRWIVGDEFLFGGSDPGEIAEKIKSAYTAAGTSVPARVEKAAAFSWTSIGAKYRDFLREVVDTSSGNRASGRA